MNDDAIVHRYKGRSCDVFKYPTLSEIFLRSYQVSPLIDELDLLLTVRALLDAAIHTFDI